VLSSAADVFNIYLCKYINIVNRRQKTEILIILLSREREEPLVPTFPMHSKRRRSRSKVIRINDTLPFNKNTY
jgi:hypothetical protein